MKTIDYHNIYDSSTRIGMLSVLQQLVGFSEDDLAVLAFAVLGNADTKENPDVMEVLHKMKLPKPEVSFNEKKVKRYANMLEQQLKKFDEFGVMDMSADAVVKIGKSDKYMTVFSAKTHPLIYWKIIQLLRGSPGYTIRTLYGLKMALDIICEFVEAELSNDK